MATELATAYISLAVSGKGLRKDIDKAVGASAAGGDRAGRGLGASVAGGFKKAALGGFAGAGLVAGAALAKGFGRLKSLDEARGKLEGLGHSTKAVDGIMKNALASVKGTAFGMDEAASTAAGSVAAGIKPGKALEKNLKLVADAATIAGTDMGSMGSIFNKVAASNKIQGDVIAQLGDQGIPVLQFLSKEMGVSAEEVSKLASAGKVDFKTFQSAMETGLGGAAQKSGETFSGSLKNAGAALGRLGASLLGGVFPQLKGGLGGVTDLLDQMGPTAEAWGKKVGDAVGVVSKYVGDFVSDFKNGEGAAGDLRTVLESVAGFVSGTLLPVLKSVGGFLIEHRKTVALLVAAYVGFKVVSSIMRAYRAVILMVRGAQLGYAAATYGAAGASMVQTRAEKVGLIVGKAKLVMMKAVTVATKAWAVAQRVLNAVMRMNPIGLVVTALIALGAGLVLAYKKSETFRRIVDAAWAGVKKAAKAVVDWWTGTAWPAIKKFFTNIGSNMVKAKDKIVGAWDSIKAKVVAVKDWITNTAWPALKSTLYKLSGFIPVVAIYRNWDKITGKFKAAWEWVRDKFSLWWAGIKQIFTNPIDSAKTIVTRLLSATGLRKPILAVWTWVRDTFKRSWAGIKKIFTDPIDSAKTLIGRALGKDGLQKTFRSAVGALGRIWDGIKKKLSSPIVSALKWLNRGFIGKLNSLLKKVPGVDLRIPDIGIPKGFATGGWTGPGSKYAPAGVVHADEFVVKKSSRNKFERDNPGTLDHINRFGTLPGYAIGGKVDGLNKKFLEQLSAFNDAAGGRFSVNSGYRSNAHQQQLYNRYLAGNGPVAARPGSSQHNFGLAADLAPGNARDTHGALARQFGLAFTVPSESWHVEPAGGRSGKSSGGFGFSLPAWVKNPLTWAKGKVAGLTKSFLGNKDKYGIAGHVLPAAFTAMRDAVGKRVKSAASVFGLGGGASGMDLTGIQNFAGGVERWRPTVLRALGIMGLSDKYANSTLRRMKQESGGNPRAINNWDSNAKNGTPSKGLMQVIDPTFRAYAKAGYNKDIYDPLSNILASMRYARARYGTLWAAYDRKGGYSDGGLVKPAVFDNGGTLAPGLNLVNNKLGKPEALVRPEQAMSGGATFNLHDVDGVLIGVIRGEIDTAARDADRLARRGA